MLAQEWTSPRGQRAGLWPSWQAYSQHTNQLASLQPLGQYSWQHAGQKPKPTQLITVYVIAV